MGAEADAPANGPEGAPTYVWMGYTGRNPPMKCDACRCEPPAGTCELPTELTVNAATCTPPAGTPQTSFDAPSMWDGACTAANPVSMMGVQSLSIEPMKIKQTACAEAVDPTPAQGTRPPAWETFGIAFYGESGETCGRSGNYCANVAPGNGYRHCIWRTGTHDEDTGEKLVCPAPYLDKFLFYEAYEDRRDCSPCVCGVPEGSTCTAQISVYSNAACSGNPLLEWTHDQALYPPKCLNLPSGAPLLSKMATDPTYTPGTCEPYGGNPIGSVVGLLPVTACCIPLP